MLNQQVAEKKLQGYEDNVTTQLKGLCSTCIHAGECTFMRDPNAPVMFCEEFEVESAPKRKIEVHESSLEELPGRKNLKGLCLNCANAATCTYPKPETGVWHCEEYR